MPIQMYKGKNSKVVDNRDVRQHRKDGWVFQKPSPVEKPARTRRPRATLKADPIVKQVNDLPDLEDFKIEE